MVAEEENFTGLARINRELIGKVEAPDSPQRVVLDMDSTGIPVHGLAGPRFGSRQHNWNSTNKRDISNELRQGTF
jgi:hypothetical protein